MSVFSALLILFGRPEPNVNHNSYTQIPTNVSLCVILSTSLERERETNRNREREVMILCYCPISERSS